MFCKNCGTKLNDDAVFCLNCGIRVKTEQNTENVSEAVPVIRPVSEAAVTADVHEEVVPEAKLPGNAAAEEIIPVSISLEQMPAAAPQINSRPEQINAVQSQYIGDNRSQSAFIPNNQPHAIYSQGGAEKEKTRKNIIGFSVASVIFALLTIGAAVLEMLDAVSDIPDTARLIEISIVAILLIIYAFANSRVVSVMKGIGLTILMIADIIFVGFDTIKYAIETLTGDGETKFLSIFFGRDEWVILVYFFSILIWCAAMYIFFVIDAIRGFTGTRKIKTFTLFFGFAAAAALTVNICFRVIIEGGTYMYSNIVPLNLIYIFLILSMCFGIMGKRKNIQ